jgi:hypothetical protein
MVQVKELLAGGVPPELEALRVDVQRFASKFPVPGDDASYRIAAERSADGWA